MDHRQRRREVTGAPSSAPEVTEKPATPKSKKKAAQKPANLKRNVFADDINVDRVDETAEKARIKKIHRVLQMQVGLIFAMVLFFMLGGNIIQTTYEYYALDSAGHLMRLPPLFMPNMTNQAVLSWATNSITEIMTFGFGDYLPHLREQQSRFTKGGWEAFVNAFDKMDIGKLFKERQLVLTTVPSDTAVILSQGPAETGYEWKIQVPVIMTYATNDNVTHRSRAIVTLVITRVPTSQDPIGIAIKTWIVG
jgi:hypothetical protein